MSNKEEKSIQQTADSSLVLSHLEEDAGMGTENIGMKDMVVPLLFILQSGSPQVKKSEPDYMPEAEESMFFNKNTKRLYEGESKGILVIPCFYDMRVFEWSPDRGGLRGIHPIETTLKSEAKWVEDKDGKRSFELPNGNSLVDTAQYFCLLLDEDDGPTPIVIPMYSTALKKSREWNTLVKNLLLEKDGKKFNPAMFSQIYTMRTEVMAKDNHSWWTWKIDHYGSIADPELYTAAKQLHQMASKGAVQADTSSANEGGDVPF